MLRSLGCAGVTLLLAVRIVSAAEVECAPKTAVELGVLNLAPLEESCLRLAEQGNVLAQRNIGWLYDGLIPDRLADSAIWYRRAAEQGDARSQANLAFKYLQGRGVLKDYGEALVWFRASARQGYAFAQGYLCIMYADGLGTEVNNVKAYAWCNIATVTAPNDDLPPAEYVEVRERVAAKMGGEEIARAQVFSRECIESSYAGCD